MLEVEKALNRFAKEVVRSSESNLIRQGKRSSGTLYNAIDSDLSVSNTGSSFSLTFTLGDYGEFVDKGVSGKKKRYNTPYRFTNKMPPRKNIKDWINRKRIRLRDDKGKFKKGSTDSLAFLIQRSIFNKGIKPSLFFTKAFNKHFDNFPPELKEAFALDVEDLIEFTLKRNGTTNN